MGRVKRRLPRRQQPKRQQLKRRTAGGTSKTRVADAGSDGFVQPRKLSMTITRRTSKRAVAGADGKARMAPRARRPRRFYSDAGDTGASSSSKAAFSSQPMESPQPRETSPVRRASNMIRSSLIQQNRSLVDRKREAANRRYCLDEFRAEKARVKRLLEERKEQARLIVLQRKQRWREQRERRRRFMIMDADAIRASLVRQLSAVVTPEEAEVRAQQVDAESIARLRPAIVQHKRFGVIASKLVNQARLDAKKKSDQSELVDKQQQIKDQRSEMELRKSSQNKYVAPLPSELEAQRRRKRGGVSVRVPSIDEAAGKDADNNSPFSATGNERGRRSNPFRGQDAKGSMDRWNGSRRSSNADFDENGNDMGGPVSGIEFRPSDIDIGAAFSLVVRRNPDEVAWKQGDWVGLFQPSQSATERGGMWYKVPEGDSCRIEWAADKGAVAMGQYEFRYYRELPQGAEADEAEPVAVGFQFRVPFIPIVDETDTFLTGGGDGGDESDGKDDGAADVDALRAEMERAFKKDKNEQPANPSPISQEDFSFTFNASADDPNETTSAYNERIRKRMSTLGAELSNAHRAAEDALHYATMVTTSPWQAVAGLVRSKHKRGKTD